MVEYVVCICMHCVKLKIVADDWTELHIIAYGCVGLYGYIYMVAYILKWMHDINLILVDYLHIVAISFIMV